MLQPRSIQSTLSIRDKILSIDFIMVISILILGITSMFAMYSTDGGEFKYHTNSHILRFFVFFAIESGLDPSLAEWQALATQQSWIDLKWKCKNQ